ncbi:MAG: nucleotidyltransferase family protein [Candidatus Woesearchaeota archaeon]
MKKRNEIISYALAFTSFIVRRFSNIDKIILFGSITRNDFDEKSDIDIFIQTKINEEKIIEVKKIFEKSIIHQNYVQRGIKQFLSLKIGQLVDWPSLKDSILDNGIILYGKYEEAIRDFIPFTIYYISTKKLLPKTKVRIWRNLYGYKQKSGKKIYENKGLIKELNGKRLGDGVFAVPKRYDSEIISFLNKNKIKYNIEDSFFSN